MPQPAGSSSASSGAPGDSPPAVISQLKKYRKIKYLGKGSYGAAILVELRSDPSKKYVIKEIIIGHLKPLEQQTAKNEAGVLNQLSHSNITSYIESFVESAKLYIVMEFADGGDLSEAIKAKKEAGTRWSEEEIMRIFVQICLALKHVHDTNILHRDLKSQNIFLTSKGIVKLGDFGIAKILDSTDDKANTQIGTPYYLSPEICESQPYGRQSDVWSLGVVLFEIAALEMPFQASSLHALVHKICNYEPDYAAKLPSYSPNLINLIKRMLSKEPSKRPSLFETINSDYIKTHISRLLSHTIRSGTGGCIGAPPRHASDVEEDLSPVPNSALNANANRDRDRAENKEDSNNSGPNNNRNNSNRDDKASEEIQKLREDGRKQLRNFRDNIIRKNGDNSSQNMDNFVVQLPAAQYVNNDRNNDRNNVHNNNNNNNNSNNSGANNSAANGVNGRSNQPTPRSLAEIQQERNRAHYGNNNNNNNASSVSTNYNDNNQNVAVRNVNGYANNNGSEYSRNEFFRNREAAAAVKARVEAYERNGSYQTAGNNTTNFVGGDGDVDASPSAEERIAMLKLRKEEREKQELAEKQKQIQDAHEANKQYRRELSTKKALAFEVDVTPSAANAAVANLKVGNSKKGTVADGSNNSPPNHPGDVSRNSAVAVSKKDRPGVPISRASSEGSQDVGCVGGTKLRSMSVDETDNDSRPRIYNNSNNSSDSTPTHGNSSTSYNTNSSSNIGTEGQRKGWNIPQNGNFQFQVPNVGVVQIAGASAEQNNSNPSSRSNSSSRISPSYDDRMDKKKVARDQAREIFRKLKDQKAKKQGENNSPSVNILSTAAAQEKQSDSGISSNRTALSTDSKASAKAASRESPSHRQRALQGAMSKVDEVKMSVQNIAINVPNRDGNKEHIEKADSKTSDLAYGDISSRDNAIKRIELKDFDGISGNVMFPIEECYSDEEELERTLDKWLKNQHLTKGSDQATSEVVDETEARSRLNSAPLLQEVHEVNEDEELLAMQCALANALIVGDE